MSANDIMNELNNKYYGSFNLFGFDIWITQTIIVIWIWMAILIAFALIVRSKLNKWNETEPPKGFQNFVELVIEIVDNYVSDTMGSNYRYFGSYFFGVFVLIICMNFSGLILQRPPTADLSTTASFGIVTFLLIHFMGITKNTKEYFKGYTSPFFVMLPLNIISELATPVSLSFRLFGATLGGLIIVNLAYALLPIFLKIGFPVILHVYFDIFAGALQAFIFVTLSMTFIRDKLPE